MKLSFLILFMVFFCTSIFAQRATECIEHPNQNLHCAKAIHDSISRLNPGDECTIVEFRRYVDGEICINGRALRTVYSMFSPFATKKETTKYDPKKHNLKYQDMIVCEDNSTFTNPTCEITFKGDSGHGGQDGGTDNAGKCDQKKADELRKRYRQAMLILDKVYKRKYQNLGCQKSRRGENSYNARNSCTRENRDEIAIDYQMIVQIINEELGNELGLINCKS